MVGGHAPFLCRGFQRVAGFGERPVQPAVEDVAAGHAQPLFQVECGRGLNAGPAVRVGQQDFLNRFGQNGIQRCEHGFGEQVTVGRERRVRSVQTEYGQGGGT